MDSRFRVRITKSNLLVKHNGTAGRHRPCKKELKEHESQGREENRKTMLSPCVAWKCQARNNWLFTSGVYSTRWEVSQRRLLSCGVSKTVVAQLAVVSSKVSLRCRFNKLRLWQYKATVEYVVGQDRHTNVKLKCSYSYQSKTYSRKFFTTGCLFTLT